MSKHTKGAEMARDRIWVVGLIAQIVRDRPTAEMVVDRLMEEGVLHLGYGNADIDQVIEAFTETFGTTRVSKYDRFAANRLVAKYGSQSVVGIIRLLGQHSTEKFAPTVNTISQLEDKIPSVLRFLRGVSQDDEIVQL